MNNGMIQGLVEALGPTNVLTVDDDLFLYAYDASFPEHRPDVAVFAQTTEDVTRVMSVASAEGVPVVPRGAGTGLSGGSVPASGGIALILTQMNRLCQIDVDNLTAEVEAGVINAHLQAAVAPHGLFFPPDPASMKVCTIGGNISEDAGGPKCLKYGVTRNYVLGLEAVLPTGEVLETGGSVVKNTTGYDLTRLFVGSEGTLGVVTKAQLRLLPLPEAKRTMLALFDTLEAASRAVSAIIAASIIPSALEMLDNLLIRAAEDYTKVGLPTDAAALLLIEVDGAEAALDAEVEAIRGICQEAGARDFKLATSAEEVDRLWLARRTVIGAAGRIRPSLVLQDVTVQRSLLPTMVRRVEEISKKYDLPIGVLAHAGDGNLHPLLLFDARSADDLRRVEGAEHEIFESAIELGGTLTGEHGIGMTKLKYLHRQLNTPAIRVTKGIKAVFDPQNILNPGKIVL